MTVVKITVDPDRPLSSASYNLIRDCLKLINETDPSIEDVLNAVANLYVTALLHVAAAEGIRTVKDFIRILEDEHLPKLVEIAGVNFIINAAAGLFDDLNDGKLQ